jgi:uncharacterized protein
MRFEREPPAALNVIRSYEPGLLRIGEHNLHCSLIVSADQLLENWRPREIADLQSSDFEPVLTLGPEIVLFGSGRKQTFPDPALLAPIHARGIGLEIMDTGAACRTFNLLVSEGRKVVAALIVEPR